MAVQHNLPSSWKDDFLELNRYFHVRSQFVAMCYFMGKGRSLEKPQISLSTLKKKKQKEVLPYFSLPTVSGTLNGMLGIR